MVKFLGHRIPNIKKLKATVRDTQLNFSQTKKYRYSAGIKISPDTK